MKNHKKPQSKKTHKFLSHKAPGLLESFEPRTLMAADASHANPVDVTNADTSLTSSSEDLLVSAQSPTPSIDAGVSSSVNASSATSTSLVVSSNLSSTPGVGTSHTSGDLSTNGSNDSSGTAVAIYAPINFNPSPESNSPELPPLEVILAAEDKVKFTHDLDQFLNTEGVTFLVDINIISEAKDHVNKDLGTFNDLHKNLLDIKDGLSTGSSALEAAQSKVEKANELTAKFTLNVANLEAEVAKAEAKLEEAEKIHTKAKSTLANLILSVSDGKLNAKKLLSFVNDSGQELDTAQGNLSESKDALSLVQKTILDINSVVNDLKADLDTESKEAIHVAEVAVLAHNADVLADLTTGFDATQAAQDLDIISIVATQNEGFKDITNQAIDDINTILSKTSYPGTALEVAKAQSNAIGNIFVQLSKDVDFAAIADNTKLAEEKAVALESLAADAKDKYDVALTDATLTNQPELKIAYEEIETAAKTARIEADKALKFFNSISSRLSAINGHVTKASEKVVEEQDKADKAEFDPIAADGVATTVSDLATKIEIDGNKVEINGTAEEVVKVVNDKKAAGIPFVLETTDKVTGEKIVTVNLSAEEKAKFKAMKQKNR